MTKEAPARLERRMSKSGVDLRHARHAFSETDATRECQSLSELGLYCLAAAKNASGSAWTRSRSPERADERD